jgi:purine nucleosidase
MNTNKTKKIFIDTDCGMDDIIAISMLLLDTGTFIKGISTVRGLTSPIVGANNLRKILRYLSKNISVAAGSSIPINPTRQTNRFPKQDIINSSSLSFLDDLIGKTIRPVKTTGFCIEDYIFKSTTGGVDFLCLGPLTNVAKTINRYGDRFLKNINRLIIMGGAVFSPGNVPPQKKAEYNFFLDPEAANIVLGAEVPKILIATDATRYVPVSTKSKKEIARLKPRKRACKLIQKIITANQKDFNYFYDPLTAGIIINPQIATQSKKVALQTSIGYLNLGRCFLKNNQVNINLVTKIDKGKFFALLSQNLK